MEHVNCKGFIRILFPSSRIAFKIQWMATSLFKSIPLSVFLLLTRPRRDGRALNSSCLVLSCFSLSYRTYCKLHSLGPSLSKLSFLSTSLFRMGLECPLLVYLVSKTLRTGSRVDFHLQKRFVVVSHNRPKWPKGFRVG